MMTAQDLQTAFAAMLSDFMEKQQPPQAPAKEADPLELLTKKDVCGIFHVKPAALIEWAKRGILKPIKVGARVNYRRSDIEALVREAQA